MKTHANKSTPHYRVEIGPTCESPRNARLFTLSPPYGSVDAALSDARNYLSTYPERKQRAVVILEQVVAQVIPD